MIRQNGATGGLTPDPARAKQELRRRLAERVRDLTAAQRLLHSAAICDRIAALTEFPSSAQIVVYRALADEPVLDELIGVASRMGKRLFEPSGGEPGFGSCDDGGGLEAEPTLLVVPGRGYDRAGRRLGRGGGWYDRALARLPARSCVVGVGFACQIVPELPVESHDLGVDYVITEMHVVDCRAR